MFRRILVPIDGSATAGRGLAEAIRMAKESGAKLRLVHVVDESVALGATEAGLDTEALVETLEKNGRAVLAKASRSAEKRGVQAETAIYESIEGPAADAILREARKWRADVIVMGSHGRRGIRRLVLGSDAEQVMRRTTVPVLLIRATST